jgi:hypothetical protein
MMHPQQPQSQLASVTLRQRRSSVITYASSTSAASIDDNTDDTNDKDNTSSSAAAAKTTTTTGGTASMSQEIFSLVKNIVGAGVLGLPAGIAAFGSAPGAVFPALLLIAGIGGLSAYGFALIGRVCALVSSIIYERENGMRFI